MFFFFFFRKIPMIVSLQICNNLTFSLLLVGLQEAIPQYD